ncbi:MAG: TIR domain-containing protein [Egibacteraceae bacterium]
MQGSRFDVFLSHHSADSSVVEQLAERLRGEGIAPWLDRWRLRPGDDWQEEIIRGLGASDACAVCVGPPGLGDWARLELRVAQDRVAKNRAFRLFMVLLPGAPNPDDPSLAFLFTRTWADLRAGIDDPDGLGKLVFALNGVARRAPAASEAAADACPYRGLEVFDEAHAEFFFGRDDDTRRVVEKLKGSRFLAVLGPSGSGKSSLVRAGVIPALKGGALARSEAWGVHLVTPGARPLSLLAALVARLLPHESMLQTLDRMRTDDATLDTTVSLALADTGADERLVLVIDQVEELFTLCTDDAERAAFVGNLCYAAAIPGGRVVVLVAMRADFYHRCAAYPELRALMADRQFLVGPMDRDGLREAIERPAARVGLELEAGLVETILDDVADRPGGLPLLEHVLLEVWRRRREGLLTLEAYVAAGGVAGALAQRADAIYEGLMPVQRPIARRVLLRLIQPGEGTEDTRRRVPAGELLSRSEEQADLDAAVKALADARLLTTSRDEVTQAPVVEIAHEALIRGWPRLRGWIDEARDTLRAHRRLTEAAAEWDQNGREEEFLYRGVRLAGWQDRPTEDLNDLERSFLASSRQREARERAAKRLRTRLTVAISAIVVVVLALAQVYRVTEQRDVAFSRQLAANARDQLELDPQLGLLLARQAFEVSPTAEAQSALRQATLDAGKHVLRGHDDTVLSVAFSRDGQRIASASADGTIRIWDLAGRTDPVVLRGHSGTVYDAVFSPDGQRIASASADGTVRIWNPTSPADPLVLTGHSDEVNSVAFSPDGQRITSASDDGTVRIWNPTNPADLITLTGHDDTVFDVAFSPDGQRIASASADGTVRIWDPTSPADPITLTGLTDYGDDVDSVAFSPDGQCVASAEVIPAPETAPEPTLGSALGPPPAVAPGLEALPVYGVAFSPDGQRIASASADGTIRIWDPTNPTDPITLTGHNGTTFDVAFSPDGQRVAGASADGTIRIWDPTSPADPITLTGHSDEVNSVAFSHDGQRIASASDDGTIRIWDPTSPADPITLTGHDGVVYGVAFSHDGQRIASASADGTVRIWDPTSPGDPTTLTGHNGSVYDVAFSHDGQRVASASADGTIRIRDLTGPGDRIALCGHSDEVNSVAFSPDGQRVASASDDGTVRIWDPTSPADPITLTGHSGPVLGVTFSRDGQRVASASDDRTVRIWDPTNPTNPTDPITTLRGHNDTVFDVAFSSDGQRIASASDDGTVRIWDLTDSSDPIVLGSGAASVGSVAFSRDGQRIVGAGADGTVLIWDLASPADPIALTGHSGEVGSVAFSPDGQRIASASDDGTIRIWECEVEVCGPIEQVVTLAERRVTRELTAEEREAFLHERA